SIAPILAPIAAGCLLITMIAAVAVHVRRKETAVPAIVLAVLTAVSTVLGFAVVL
ncbi:MAG: DoxX family protein, partial [Actinobacteria bacterium]|nr:DoxX family protein [Actinomycetota bacterium]